jgi:hypothetical protein
VPGWVLWCRGDDDLLLEWKRLGVGGRGLLRPIGRVISRWLLADVGRVEGGHGIQGRDISVHHPFPGRRGDLGDVRHVDDGFVKHETEADEGFPLVILEVDAVLD